MFSKNNLFKLNLISCHGNKRKLNVVQDEMIGDLNGSKSN